ncbi:MAG: diacylglycerol kinase [Burkholderiaceae bacterium]|jgi:diacylglycerol kinase (ATP)|nr:diacylglycerol kinase [Aquabacterium sp.]NUP84470.1 diacylglycerol kinase [Burkholderiaceae bacterium]
MSNPHKGRTGWQRIIWATHHSLHGLKLAWCTENAFRQEATAAALMLPASLWLGRSGVEVALLAGSVLAVLIVELLNSAVEAAIDRVSYELHDLSRRAKDFGSAAVLLSLLACASVWLGVLYDRLGAP